MMHKHNCTGPERVREARERREKAPAERMAGTMVWMAYGWLVAAGIFLHAAGWM